jgi:zinc/manganese transport system permease protein
MWEILAAPFAACLILTGIHCYLGIHVVMREVIFVDLALAQIAAMGAAVGVLAGLPPDSAVAYFCSLGFTFLGAGIFALGRFRGRRVPQEAVIGIAYAVSSALALLILSKIAVEQHEIESMLVGQLIYVGPGQVAKITAIYAAVALVHVVFRRPFFAVSEAGLNIEGAVRHVRAWDFLFYATFGVVVTSSVQVAGVLLVFSYLIVPAACAMIFFASLRARLIAGWLFGLAGSALGLLASARWDLPTGTAIVAGLGIVFALVVAAHGVRVVRQRFVSSAAPSGADAGHTR